MIAFLSPSLAPHDSMQNSKPPASSTRTMMVQPRERLKLICAECGREFEQALRDDPSNYMDSELLSRITMDVHTGICSCLYLGQGEGYRFCRMCGSVLLSMA